MAESPTSRTLTWLRKNGYTADVVERTIPMLNGDRLLEHLQSGKKFVPSKKKDFLGFADLIAIKPPGTIVAVQATSGSHHANRLKKIEAEPKAQEWLRAGGKILMISWSKKLLKKGGKAMRWTPRLDWIEKPKRRF